MYTVSKNVHVHRSNSVILVEGYVEPAHMSDFTFETQRRTFTSYGKDIKKIK